MRMTVLVAVAAVVLALSGLRTEAQAPQRTSPPSVNPATSNTPAKSGQTSPSSPVNPAQKSAPAPTVSTTPVNVPDLWKQVLDLNQKLNQDVTELHNELKSANDHITQLQSQVSDLQTQYAKHTHTYYTTTWDWTAPYNLVNNPNMGNVLVPYKPQDGLAAPRAVATSPPN